jgi:hypothetical protein
MSVKLVGRHMSKAHDLNSMLQSFEVPIIEWIRNHATSLKQCLNCQLSFSFQISYVSPPSICTRPSVTCLLLCTCPPPHHIPHFKSLVLSDGIGESQAFPPLESGPCAQDPDARIRATHMDHIVRTISLEKTALRQAHPKSSVSKLVGALRKNRKYTDVCELCEHFRLSPQPDIDYRPSIGFLYARA